MKSRIAAKICASMTEAEFDNGYWYADDLRRFAEEIGVPSDPNTVMVISRTSTRYRVILCSQWKIVSRL